MIEDLYTFKYSLPHTLTEQLLSSPQTWHYPSDFLFGFLLSSPVTLKQSYLLDATRDPPTTV